jgi:exosortase
MDAGATHRLFEVGEEQPVAMRKAESRNRWFGFCILVVVLANGSVLRELLSYAFGSEHSSQILLVPFVSGVLVYRKRREILSLARYAVKPGLTIGSIAVGLGIAARVFGKALAPADGLALGAAAMVGACLAAFILFYGWSAFRAGLFPLSFLCFLIPLPTVALDGAIQFLQRGSTEATGFLFGLTGTPFYRNEFVFALPGQTIEVAKECSGIRSSMALLLTTLIAGHLFLKTTWRKGLLAVLVLPLVVLKNGIRIVTITLLAIHVDPRFLSGHLHRDGGVVFFLLALLILFPCFALLIRSERRYGSKEEDHSETASGASI